MGYGRSNAEEIFDPPAGRASHSFEEVLVVEEPHQSACDGLVVTHVDHRAPGEPPCSILPLACGPDRRGLIGIHIGPAPHDMATHVIIGLSDELASNLEVRLNSHPCRSVPNRALPYPMHPGAKNLQQFLVPPDAIHDGHNLIEVAADAQTTIVWAEISIE